MGIHVPTSMCDCHVANRLGGIMDSRNESGMAGGMGMWEMRGGGVRSGNVRHGKAEIR